MERLCCLFPLACKKKQEVFLLEKEGLIRQCCVCMPFALLVTVKMLLMLSLENHIIIYSSHSHAHLLTPGINVEARFYGGLVSPLRKPGKEEGVVCEL